MLGRLTFSPGRLRGELSVPGDKSISHRALIAAASLRHPVRITNLNPGRDVTATFEGLCALGVRAERGPADAVVQGAPLRPPGTLQCHNSGSTARMLLGACAGAGVAARFDGDDSLRRRPMEPVAAQLRAFGARIDTAGGYLPLDLHGTPAIQTRSFILLAPSAQVKSALLFAGLFANEPVRVAGDRGSRDHTERLLRYLGGTVAWDGRTVTLAAEPLVSRDIQVPGDFSSAAFFLTAAAIVPGSSIVVRDTGVNPTRTGLLEVLTRMGARLELRNSRTVCDEPRADVAVEYAPLRGIAVDRDLALRAVDEIPLVALAAAFAEGETRIAGVGDLRFKESDRVAGIVRLLEAVGVAVDRTGNDLKIRGGNATRASGAGIDARGDHRIAMAAAVLGCAAGPISVEGDPAVGVSFPGFVETLDAVRLPA